MSRRETKNRFLNKDNHKIGATKDRVPTKEAKGGEKWGCKACDGTAIINETPEINS